VTLPTRRNGNLTAPRLIIVAGAIGVALIAGLLVASIDSRPKQSNTAADKHAVEPAAAMLIHRPKKDEIEHTLEDVQKPTMKPVTLNRFNVVQVIPSDGAILADGRKLEIYGLTLPPRTRACRRADGERWACGLRAIVTLYNLISHSSMVCEIEDKAPSNPAKCKVGQIDVAATMLRNGWAELTPGTNDKSYVEAQAAARAARVGIWSDTEMTQDRETQNRLPYSP
jgi:endonuclease YncB( thermonuclease family)